MYALNNPVYFIDPDGMEATADYFTNRGKYLGNDGVDDKKVKIAAEGSYTANDKGGYNIKNSGISELKDKAGNSVDINTFTHLAATLYSEGSSTSGEAAGIFSVLNNRANLEGTSLIDQASTEKGVYGASAEGLSKYSSVNADGKMKENANMGVILGFTTPIDYSNGAYYWDGKDFNGANDLHGGFSQRYSPGYMFTDTSHDLWNQGNNKIPGKSDYGNWNYKYKSTGAAGNTTFSTGNYKWRDAQLPSTRVQGPMGTKFGRKL